MFRRVWIDLARPRVGATRSSNSPPAIFFTTTGGGFNQMTRRHMSSTCAIHLVMIEGRGRVNDHSLGMHSEATHDDPTPFDKPARATRLRLARASAAHTP